MRWFLLIGLTLSFCWLFRATGSTGQAKEPASFAPDYQDVVYLGETRPLLLRLHISIDGRPLPAVWRVFLTRIFQHLDRNSDGVLDRAEAQRLPAPGVLFAGAIGPDGSAAPFWGELDANGDGKVTCDELAAYFLRTGFGPFQVPISDNASHEMDLTGSNLFGALILNEVNFVVEGTNFWQVHSSGLKADSLNEALFKLLDSNGDGKLSREELLAAPRVLLKRDRNEDEMVSAEEITPARAISNDMLIDVSGSITYYGAANRHRQNKGPFRLVRPGESSLELARVLQGRYGGNGLTRERLGLDVATFARLDIDGNGRLDLEELARFSQRLPDLELKVHLGQKPAVELIKRGTPAEENVRPGRDGALILDLGSIRVDLKGLLAPKADMAQAARQMRQRYIEEFKAADRDQNGYLDRTEALRHQLFGSTFKQMDRDNDGKVFENEMLTFVDSFLDLQAAAQASCVSVGLSIEGKGLFELLNTRKDGRLSLRELRNAVKLIEDLDRDGDGAISRNEIPRCFQAAFRIGPAENRFQNQYFVTVQDGRVMRQQPQAPLPARGPEWFRKMDRNGDGDVSRREFLGTDEQFRAIDTNGDGLISIREAEAYEAKRRQQREKK